jgi:hypothetical protein
MPRNIPLNDDRESSKSSRTFYLLSWVSVAEKNPDYLHFEQCKEKINYRPYILSSDMLRSVNW